MIDQSVSTTHRHTQHLSGQEIAIERVASVDTDRFHGGVMVDLLLIDLVHGNAECVGHFDEPQCAAVCPVDNCITMVRQTEGVDPRTGRKIDPDYANWTTHPNNPMALKAAE